MNVVRACWDVVFKGPEGPVSFSCQNPKVQRAWREAFAVCRKIAVTAEDGFLGYIWPALQKGVKIPARTEVVVWGQTRRLSDKVEFLSVFVTSMSSQFP